LTSTLNFAQPDVTLRLDPAGVIRRAVVANAVSNEDIATWQGQRWAETVEGNGLQLQAMIDTAWTTGLSPVHQVRQRFPSGRALAFEYTTVRLDGDGLLAIGRSLEAVADVQSRLAAASTSMERSAWRLRNLETRQRMLNEISSQAVMLVGAGDLRILEANPAAQQALGAANDNTLLPESDVQQRATFQAMVRRLDAQSKVPGVVLRLGPSRDSWLVRASVVAEWAPVFLLKLTPAGLPRATGDATRQGDVDRAGERRVVEQAVARVERDCVAAVLGRANGDRALVAERLGVRLANLDARLARPSKK
jgi:transcriptional regulator PpsR